MKNLKFLLLLVFTGFVLMGCPPDDGGGDPPNTNTNTTDPNYVPSFSNSRGTMAAIITTHYENANDTLVGSGFGTARAMFFDENNAATMVNAGMVTTGNVDNNMKELTRKANNLYTYEENSGNGIEYHLNSIARWEVSGNSAANIPQISTSFTGFTSDPMFNQPVRTINSSSDFTLQLRGKIVNAPDSTIFAIHGPTRSIIVIKAPDAVSHTFTAAEVASAGRGQATLQVGGYKSRVHTAGGQTFHLVNEKLATQTATIE